MEHELFNLQERMKPAPLNGGLKMKGYWIWCGNVAKGEDGIYHMFASRHGGKDFSVKSDCKSLSPVL